MNDVNLYQSSMSGNSSDESSADVMIASTVVVASVVEFSGSVTGADRHVLLKSTTHMNSPS